jgi:hypothetical protein
MTDLPPDQPSRDDSTPIYARLAPPDHTRVCWAAAIGAARRGSWEDHGEKFAILALEMLADGRAPCICSRPTRRRSRPRR